MSLIALDEKTWSEATWPLGGTPHSDGVEFAVYAPAATRVQLELYDAPTGEWAYATFLPARGEDGIWRAKIQGLQLGTLYGYRVWGPNWEFDEEWEPGSEAGFAADLDEHGNRFNPNKVLFDPYAHELTHNLYSDLLKDLGVDDGCFGTGDEDYHGTPRRLVDTAPYVPKGVIVAEPPPFQRKPRIPGERATIYESSVAQLCGHPSVVKLSELLAEEPGFEAVASIPEEYRGTYRGAAMMAPYLKALGINTLELLPVHETNTSESARQGKTNSWGYMTLAFFAPNRLYSHDKSWGGPTREFRAMVDSFHEEGMEVYLDVVYNHTAEGGNWNGDVNTTGFVSLGGFATAEYYSMTSDFILVDGATGTSNQLNYSSDAARNLVMDSLKYWTAEMHIDGFRFDLATVLGRKPAEAHPDDWAAQKRFFNDHPLLVEIAEFAEGEHIEVIAEAWDLWGYEVGNFPRGWGEWNGRYRDAVRRFTKGDGNVIDFIDMFNGDYHHFHDSGGAQKTINFIVAHDGFNLADLVSYQEKQNGQEFPFGPSDGGSDNNLSWDSGGSQELRRQRVRNLWTILFFSRGVPMVVAGDELGRTQNGNNNPWELKSVAMMNNYAMVPTNQPQAVPVADDIDAPYHDNFGTFGSPEGVNGLFRFATNLIRLRQRHESLQQKSWGDLVPNDTDVSYLFHTADGQGHPAEGERAVAVYIHSPGDNFYLMINMDGNDATFTVPPVDGEQVWRRLVDTATWAEDVCNFWPEGEGEILEGDVLVPAWSVVVLQQLDSDEETRPEPKEFPAMLDILVEEAEGGHEAEDTREPEVADVAEEPKETGTPRKSKKTRTR